MKYLILLILLIFQNENLFSQKTDLQKENINGQIKTIKTFVNNKISQNRNYNRFGYLVETTSYCSDTKSICEYVKITYNDAGLKQSSISEMFTELYSYNNFGNLINEITLNSVRKDSVMLLTYTYDQNRKIKFEQFVYEKNKRYLYGSVEFSYNSAGKLSQEIIFSYFRGSKSIQTISKKKYTYDLRGNIIEETIETGKEFSRFLHVYDEKNLKIEYHAITNNPYSYYERYKYDLNNNLVETQNFTLDDKLNFRDEFILDPNNNLIKRSTYHQTKLTNEEIYCYINNLKLEKTTIVNNKTYSRTEYAYDFQGNIISQALYNDKGIVISKIDYSIEYYK